MKKILVSLMALMTLGACTRPLTSLSDCVTEVSRSNSGDVMRCAGHEPIALKNFDPVVTQCVLNQAAPSVPDVVEPMPDVSVPSVEVSPVESETTVVQPREPESETVPDVVEPSGDSTDGTGEVQ